MIRNPSLEGAGAGQHGDEPAAVGVDVRHRFGGGQLAVGDVEEIGCPGQRDQGVPGRDVGGVVIGVPVGEPVGDRYGAVAGHRQDAGQLRQVGAMVLGVAAGRRGGRLGAAD
jgi:hypothetical protein